MFGLVMTSRRWAAVTIVALAGSAGFGVFTAWLGEVEAEGSQPPRFELLQKEIPPYPNAFFFPMGRDLHTNGSPREMGYAVSEDPPRKVADRYEAIWNSRGQQVERLSGENEETLIATHPRDPIIRTVIVTAAADGQTVIIASVSEKFTTAKQQLIPVPASCDVITSNGARDGRIVTEMVFLGCEAPLEEILAYYNGHLGSARAEVRVGPTMDHKDAQISYLGDRIHVDLMASQAEDEPPRTAVSITWQEER